MTTMPWSYLSKLHCYTVLYMVNVSVAPVPVYVNITLSGFDKKLKLPKSVNKEFWSMDIRVGKVKPGLRDCLVLL